MRKKIVLSDKDWERIELYMKSGATQKKIAESFGIEPDTLRKKYVERYNEGYEQGQLRFHSMGQLLIEATQMQQALSGNIKMLIWLGKVRCGQRETDIASTIPVMQPDIDKDHLIMQLEHKIATLTEVMENNGDKSETEQKLL
jgi:transposase-like protein